MDLTEMTGLKKATFEEKIEKFCNLSQHTQELIKAAVKARRNAYVPYSHFKVGAAFRTKCGSIITGCNVESSSFTPSSCAERTALAKAISDGFSEFSAAAVVAFQQNGVLTTPCGVCRQFIMEFAEEDILLFITRDRTNGSVDDIDPNEPVLCTSAYSLLPHGFRTYK